jgi:hypothetical protein
MAAVDPARYAALHVASLGQSHHHHGDAFLWTRASSSAQRRDAFGDEVHTEDQE